MQLGLKVPWADRAKQVRPARRSTERTPLVEGGSAVTEFACVVRDITHVVGYHSGCESLLASFREKRHPATWSPATTVPPSRNRPWASCPEGGHAARQT